MIQMRWLDKGVERKLQFRYRLGGIGVPAQMPGYGLQMSQNEGWSDWQDVPVVIEELPESPLPDAPEAQEENPG